MKRPNFLVRFGALWLLMQAVGLVGAYVNLMEPLPRAWRWFFFLSAAFGAAAFFAAYISTRRKA